MSIGMTDLSQEIISLIASYLQRRCWKSGRGPSAYATISRSWQHAIERLTFREIAVESTELVDLSHIVVNHRRRLLTRLELNVVLPTYTDKARAKFENDKDMQSNNQVFTKAIKDLLALLRSWHDESQTTGNHGHAPIQQSLRLCIGDCYSPNDWRYRDQEKYQEDRNEWHRRDLFQHRYQSSLLRLESIEGIEEIPQISSFHKLSGHRTIEPRSLAMITSKFPNLNSLYWELKDNEKRDHQSRQQTRIDFASALPMIPQGSLKRIALSFFNNPPNNQDMNPSSVLLPSLPTTDHLSLSIHALSQSEHLTYLDLGGDIVISPSLFWPDAQPKRPPSWPHLVSVKVVFSMTTADGDWYFTRDNNASDESDDDDDDDDATLTDTSSTDSSEADDDEDSTTTIYQDPDPNTPDIYNEKNVALATGEKPHRHFRSKADRHKLNPLFEAAAHAAVQMPRLQCMTLKTEVKRRRMFTFAMTYFAPGERAAGRGAGSRDVEKPRLEWVVGPSGYEPSGSILEIWRRAKGEVVLSVVER